MQTETFKLATELTSTIAKLEQDKSAIQDLIDHSNAHNRGEGYLGFYTHCQRWIHCSKEVLAYWQKAIDIELKVAQETFDKL